MLGGLIIAAPFIPIWEDAFAFLLAVVGFLYPEIKQLVFDFRHSRLLNRLIVQAEKYQSDARIHYVSDSQLEAELSSIGLVGKLRGKETERREEEGSPPPPPRQRERA